MALLNEVSEGESVLVGVSRSESLVCHVEESIVLACLDGIADLLPLFRGWVNTGGVVGACVQQEHASFWSCSNVLDHALEIKTNGVLIVVSVLLNL